MIWADSTGACGAASAAIMHKLQDRAVAFDGWRSTSMGNPFVDVNGKMLVLCRKCSGYTRVKLGGKQLNHCQSFVDERTGKGMLQ